MKPQPGEYPSDYEKYYIDLVQGEDIVKAFETQLSSSQKFLKLLSEDQGNYAYEDGKWVLKEVVGHVCDTERIMLYRALCFARGESQPLPSFDEDAYVRNSNFKSRSLSDIVNEFRLVREANIALLKSFDEKSLSSRGIANLKEFSVKAILFVVAGHELHHMNVIRTKYLS